MTTELLDGMMLAARPSGNGGVWVTFFTAQRGLVRVYCRALKASKKSMPIEPFIPFWLSCTKKNQRYFLNQAEPSGRFFTLQGVQLFAGLYVNELLYALLLEDDASHGLYDDWYSTLTKLQYCSNNPSISLTLRHFEAALLRQLGYEVSFALDTCGAPVVTDKRYQFHPGEGFVAHQEGFLGSDLLTLARGEPLEERHLVIAKRVYQAAINVLLNGREIQAQKLLKAYMASVPPLTEAP